MRQGYQLVHEESHLSFGGCEHDKPYSLDELIFVCDDYEYDYEYGPALVMGRSFSHQGREVQSWYLCLEDECYSGELYRR